MRYRVLAVSALAMAGAAACSSDTTTAPAGTAGQQQAVLQELTAFPGWTEDNAGADGAVATAAADASMSVGPLSADVASIQPLSWGRRRCANSCTQDKSVEFRNDSAFVTVVWTFDGQFLTDTTPDFIHNPGSKPLRETMTRHAVLVRKTDHDADQDPDRSGRHHDWRVAALSVSNYQAVDPANRTVKIDSLEVGIGNHPPAIITNPDSLYGVMGNHVPDMEPDDTITVTAFVTNTTGTDLTPPTRVFLHVRNSSAVSDGWRRILMTDNGDGSWTSRWRVRRAGFGRFLVDALDSETLQTEHGDDYRANLWAVPYRALQ